MKRLMVLVVALAGCGGPPPASQRDVDQLRTQVHELEVLACLEAHTSTAAARIELFRLYRTHEIHPRDYLPDYPDCPR